MFSSWKGKFTANAQENNDNYIRNADLIVTMRFTEKVLRAERRFEMRVQFVMSLTTLILKDKFKKPIHNEQVTLSLGYTD